MLLPVRFCQVGSIYLTRGHHRDKATGSSARQCLGVAALFLLLGCFFSLFRPALTGDHIVDIAPLEQGNAK